MAEETRDPPSATPPDRRPGHRSLAAQTLSGMRWSYTDAVVTGIMQLLYVSVMSRLLTPAIFGIMAIAFLTVNFGQQLSQMGVPQALIQRETISTEDIRAGFTASIATGILLFAALWVMAPQISHFFTEPDAIPVLRAMGAQFIFSSLGATSQGLLRRDLRFRALALTQLSSYFIGYLVISFGLAFAGAGIWSLVIGVLMVNLLSSILQYAMARHSLRPVFGIRRFRYLYGYGIRVSGVNVLQFLSKQLDTFAVGRYASTALLGQYNRAFTVVSAPLSRHLMIALSRVLLPAYSRIQGNRLRLRRVYSSMLTLGGALMLSIAAGMAVAAPEIVSVVLGDQWDRAADFVPFFAFALALRTMSNLTEVVAQARDVLRHLLIIQILYVVALWALYAAVGSSSNIVLFAAALFAGELVRHVVYAYMMRPIVGLHMADVIRAYAPAVVCTLTVAVFVLFARALCLSLDAGSLTTLLAEIVAGLLSLVLGIRFNPFSYLRSEFRERLSAASALEGPVGATAAKVVLGRQQ